MSLIDEPRSVRQGEELDLPALDAYLKQLDPSLLGSLLVSQYPGGASNLTYLLRYPEAKGGAGEPGAGRELVLRRPPFGHKAKGAHDMTREARVMSALKPVYPYVPQVVALCTEPALLGSEFYVMERIRGVIPRKDMPAGLQLSESQTRALCLEMVDRLIELHQVDYRAAGLAGLGKGEGYVGRQIAGWCDRFDKVRTEDVPDFVEIMRWLKLNMPARDVGSCVIHNDFRFDNLVLDSTPRFSASAPEETPRLKVIGVLDWELATIGDPLMDLGSTLAYWAEQGDPEWRKAARLQPTHLPGMLRRAEVIDYYAERTGLRSENFLFYEVYGLFRLAGILQQIYYRFARGQTDNPAFAEFGMRVSELHAECARLVGQA
jgi:aminoglycoside phosphotransferase (APT) family kinase protein